MNGQPFKVRFPFWYRGPGGQIKVAASPMYRTGGPTWGQKIMTVQPATVDRQEYAEVSGIWNTDDDPYQGIDVMKIVTEVTEQLRIDGSGSLAYNDDVRVYTQGTTNSEMCILDYPDVTFYDGKPRSGSGFPLEKENGSTFTVRFPFKYRGPAQRFKFAAALVTSPNWVWIQDYLDVPASADWEEYYSPILSGTFLSDWGTGNGLSVRKFITTVSGGLLDIGDTQCPELPASNEDAEVYVRKTQPELHEIELPDGNAYYDDVFQEAANEEKWDGDDWKARFTFKHKGPAGKMVAGIRLTDSYQTREDVEVNVTNDITLKSYPLEVYGIWRSYGLENGAGIDAIKFVETIDGELMKADKDDSVFVNRTDDPPPDPCGPSNPCEEGYECINGICVPIVTPPPPTPGDWQDWVEDHYLEIGMLAGGLIGLILAWPKSTPKGNGGKK
jgi:hypothetical protein